MLRPSDSVVWQFGVGPRKSVPLNATFNPGNKNDQRVLNYSAIFDEIEDFDPSKPSDGRYVRVEVPVTLDDGSVASAWVYFYNAPLGRAPRIASGDYLEHVRAR